MKGDSHDRFEMGEIIKADKDKLRLQFYVPQGTKWMKGNRKAWVQITELLAANVVLTSKMELREETKRIIRSKTRVSV